MASANFVAYDRTLRRMFMMRLVEGLAEERGNGFRASLVINARTGLPAVPERDQIVPARRRDPRMGGLETVRTLAT
jgi:hypothetical protein